MIASILRLIALRPLLGTAILGIPVLLLVGVGLVTVLAFRLIAIIFVPTLIILTIIFFVRSIRSKGS